MSGNRYELPQKLQNLTPYDPLTGNYRIRLDANESFLSPPPELMEELMAAVMAVDFNRYPDPYAVELCEKCAAFFGVDPSMVVAGNGSDELIGLIVSWFTEPGDTMAVVRPDFSMYSFYAQPCGLRLLAIDKDPDTLALDADALIARAREADARLLIFSNPCNPTSLAATRADVLKIVDGLPGCLVVVDEAYMDFWDQSLLGEVEEHDNLIILRTCSKMLGMAALRLGFAVANSRLTGVLRAAKSPYNVNAVTQAMANVVLANPVYQDVYRELLIASRDGLLGGFRGLEEDGLVERVYDSRTNFVYVRLKDAGRMYALLCDRGILVRRFGDRHLRVTAATQAENEELLAVMRFLLTHQEIQ